MARRNARSVSESIVRLSGSPRYLGVIDFTGTSKTNHEATTPFNNTGNALLGKVLLLQPSQACYILGVSANDGTVSATNGVYLFANERVEIVMDDLPDVSTQPSDLLPWLAVIRDSASGNLKVWELQ